MIRRGIRGTLLLILTVCSCGNLTSGSEDAKRLYNDLMKNYNKIVRPVANSSEILQVKLSMKLSQLIGVNEKNQMMTTNVWLRQEWYDHYLKWDPKSYGGIDHLYAPSSSIWKPDIALYNNGDGSYQVTLDTKATLNYDGRVVWEPPAIYKSSCTIDVEFFPFDEQNCNLKFSSWTYVYSQVNLMHLNQAEVPGEVSIPCGVDMSEYHISFVWDVMDVPAVRHEVKYPCCPEIFPDVTFYIEIRRKTLFYTVNLIIPCVAISFLTVLVFYLPSDSGEKITLCISILLSLTVFFLLLSELIPPTSLVIPLIGRYLLFTMILVTLSVIITVICLNLHNRSNTTHHMPTWVRILFLEKLPRYLLMKRPDIPAKKLTAEDRKQAKYDSKKCSRLSMPGSIRTRINKYESGGEYEAESLLADLNREMEDSKGKTTNNLLHPHASILNIYVNKPDDENYVTPELQRAASCVDFVVNHLREDDKEKQTREDWRYLAMVVDRLFLWLFTIVCCVGTLAIMLRAPTLYDGRTPISANTC